MPLPTNPTRSQLEKAETILAGMSAEMASECKLGSDGWSAEVMQKHVDDRATILNMREILVERIESAL